VTAAARGGAFGLLALLVGALTSHAWAPPPAAARPHDRLPARLSDTGLFDPARPGAIDPRNRPFAPQYPLWSDGLTKRRWVYLPSGTAIDAADEHDWRYPDGTRFWKEFGLRGRRVETRVLLKTGDGWLFGAYAWDDEGREAWLVADGVRGAVEVAPGRRHDIPSQADCAACHGTTRVGPLGFNALQLSDDRDPAAIHGEPLSDDMLTLRRLLAAGQLQPARASYAAGPRIRTADPATRAALGYLVANCGPCHDGRGDITAAAPVLRLADLLADGDGVAHGFIGQPTRWQVPGLPEATSVLVQAGAPEHSALLRRMMSRAPSSQMPPLGTMLADEEAIEALARWITALAGNVRASRASHTRLTAEKRR
jgi:cytochrome c553